MTEGLFIYLELQHADRVGGAVFPFSPVEDQLAA
jgi:hypothetical protein